MIQRIEKVETTLFSHPFGTASRKCNLEENGYVEEEYFIHGLSNVYKWKEQRRIVEVSDCPYVNRILVRKPCSRGFFSGNVVVEILNSTSFIDFDRCWALTWRHMIRNGDIYIGITSKPNVIPAMLKVDYKRYAPLSWKKPLYRQQNKIAEKDLGNMEGASSYETEDGLFWDMLTDLADLLRKKENSLIGEYYPYYQYLAGWSQSGAYIIRFVNEFAYARLSGQKYFDGYFSVGSASSCMPDLNQSYGRTALKNSRKLKRMTEPFIEMHTESENALWGNWEARGENSDDEEMLYRIYDIVGATHDSCTTMIDYYNNDSDVIKCGIIPNYPGKEIYPNAFPYEVAFQNALQMLYEWVREKKKPIFTNPVEVNKNLENVVDESGNAKGGYRLPPVDVPLCVYHPISTPMKPDFAFSCTLFGYEENYSRDKAKILYGSYSGYMEQFIKSLDKCIEEGRMLIDDRELCLEYARKKARQIF